MTTIPQIEETSLPIQKISNASSESSVYDYGRDPQNLRPQNAQPLQQKLGMFMGVFIPVTLAIWGVILFFRLGVLVGQGGLWVTIGLFGYSYMLTSLTIVSISAIVTNGKVKGGGVYYVISRSLGPELGGSIGIINVFAQIVSGGLYIVGFTDALLDAFPASWPVILHNRWVKFAFGVSMLTILTVVVYMGADLFAKTSLLIFIVLGGSIIVAIYSFIFQRPGYVFGFTGPSWTTFTNNFVVSWSRDYNSPDPNQIYSLQYAFGILFPACTGILTGANLSGDLERPDNDIPVGTMSANVFTFVIYIGLAALMALTVSKQALIEHSNIMSLVSFLPWAITLGVFSAVLSSALGAIIGASRILQAIARDEIVPFTSIFKKGDGPNDEPRRAVLLIYFGIILVTLIGEINSIAPVITVLQTLTYGFVNISCFFLSITGAPNFRPTFKLFHWSTALAGGLMCVFAIFYVSPLYSGIVIIVQLFLIVLIYFYVAGDSSWGDVSQALIYHQVRKYLLRLDANQHIKSWRLQVILMTSNPRSNLKLIEFVNHLKKGGLYIVGHVNVGEFRQSVQSIESDYGSYAKIFKEMSVKAFPDIAVAKSVREGIQNLLTQSGLGGMRPNTVIFGMFDPDSPPKESEFTGYGKKKAEKIKKALETLDQLRNLETPSGYTSISFVQSLKDCLLWRKNVIIANNFDILDQNNLSPTSWMDWIFRKKFRTIDLWLFNLREWTEVGANNDETFSFIAQLGHMIHMSGSYHHYHSLRLLNIVDEPGAMIPELERLETLIHEWRIDSKTMVYCLSENDKGVLKHSNSKMIKPSGYCFDGLWAKGWSIIDKWKILKAIVRKASVETSCIFMPMPPLPKEETKVNCEFFLEQFKMMSADLPPIMFVSACGGQKFISEFF